MPVYMPVIPTTIKLMMITLNAVALLYLPPRSNIAKPARSPIKPTKDKKAIINSKPSATCER